MAYLIKAGIGLALFFGGLVLFNVKLQEVLDIGTCASGNVPFEIRPEYQCPEGTGTTFFLLVGSIFAMLIGGAVFVLRGDPPWGERRRSMGMFGWGTLLWGLFFAGTGLALMLGGPYGEVTNESGEIVGQPDSELGANITGITFLVMGVPALLIALWIIFKGLTNRGDERSTSAGGTGGMTSGVMGRMRAGMDSAQAAQGIGEKMKWGSATGSTSKPAKGGDTIGKIERLQKLQKSGAITKAEFDKEKAKILAEQ